MGQKNENETREFPSMETILENLIAKLQLDVPQLLKLETMYDEDVMKWLNICRKTLYNLRMKGDIPFQKLGGRVIYFKLIIVLHMYYRVLTKQWNKKK